MIYLDNAATSDYKPRSVKKAVSDALSNPVSIGRTTNKKAFLYSRKIYEVRERICLFIGGKEPESVIFTSNATSALNLALKGMLKKENNHIITSFTEHNSVLRQIYSHNIDCSFIPCKPNFSVDIEKIPELIKENTRLIVLNTASNVTGCVCDWKKAADTAKKYKIPILLDFSQSIGNIPVSLKELKGCMIAFSGHKSLLGPQGTGVLYVSPELMLDTVFEGGTGSMSTELTQPEFYPDRLESGTLNTPGILGLGEGVKFVEKIGIEEIREKKTKLCGLLYEKLKNMKKIKLYHNGKFSDKIPIISFNIGDYYSDEIASELANSYGIAVRGGFHCAPYAHKIIGTPEQGAIRISPSFKTKKKDILKFIDSVNKITKK